MQFSDFLPFLISTTWNVTIFAPPFISSKMTMTKMTLARVLMRLWCWCWLWCWWWWCWWWQWMHLHNTSPQQMLHNYGNLCRSNGVNWNLNPNKICPQRFWNKNIFRTVPFYIFSNIIHPFPYIRFFILYLFQPECLDEEVEEAKMQEPRHLHVPQQTESPLETLF